MRNRELFTRRGELLLGKLREAQTPAPKPEKRVKDRGNFEIPQQDIDGWVRKGHEIYREQSRILNERRRQREKKMS
jgi:hypothetical protein